MNFEDNSFSDPNNRRPRPGINLTRLNLLSASAQQMLLGTLLADGSMDFRGGANPRYVIQHGAVQKAYCESKATLLADYIRTPSKIVRNLGWGLKACVFRTVTTPVLEFIRSLCYRQNPKFPNDPKRLIKFVNPAWLGRLTWEGIAWWYQDDGTLQRAAGSCRVAVFSTHKFPQEQVELLAQMLRDRGIDCKACPTRKGPKVFWTIRLTAASTRLFVKQIAPFVHPTMRYKIDVPERVFSNCSFCGNAVDFTTFNPERPCCRNPDCKRTRNGERGDKWIERNRPLINARAKERRNANLEESRAKARLGRQRRMSNPEYRANVNARRREWRNERMKDPAYKAKVAEQGRASYHRNMADPAKRARRNQQSNEGARRRRNSKRVLHNKTEAAEIRRLEA